LKFKRRIQVDDEGIPITNLVDVLFLLIVFFMTSTVMSFDRGLGVKLPETSGSGQISRKGVNLLVAADGRIYVDGAVVALADLGAVVRERQATAGANVILQSDRTTPYQAIAEVMDRLLEAGIGELSLPVLKREGGR
jgi:biopolymer transport protein ExbD